MTKILFTGGGSAGHVTVNIALIPHFLQRGWTVEYIGSEHGIEKKLVASIPDVKYFAVSTGKLRRYFDWRNVKDPFNVIKGVVQAYRLIKARKPSIVFSKGGFVSLPVVIGAWLNNVPVIIHESDLTPGLANKVSLPFVTAVCTTFPETAAHLPKQKAHYVGAIIREEIKRGKAESGRAFCGFASVKPVILVMGGSLGARKINQTVRQAIERLLSRFQIVHLCGKDQLDPTISSSGYRQFEYLNEELPDVLAMADVVVSRAGSNSIFELLALAKPMLLIPLTKAQSRGDQIMNAHAFEKAGYCTVLEEEQLSAETLIAGIAELYENRLSFITRMSTSGQTNAKTLVVDLINQTAKDGGLR